MLQSSVTRPKLDPVYLCRIYIQKKPYQCQSNSDKKKTKSHFPDGLLFIYVAPLAPKLAERIYILPQVYNANLCFLAVLSLSSTMPTEQ